MLDSQAGRKICKHYAYLICQGSLWADMDATRRELRVESQRVTLKSTKGDEVISECTETPLKVGTSGTSEGSPSERGD